MYDQSLNLGGELGGDATTDALSLIATLVLVVLAVAIFYIFRYARGREDDH
ncbi:hypothetical protein [Inquilinus limosus]|uniref:hypothetical protein n=1 Tax=Inquilinus limosus TaxID=171674 RepID=UPI000403E096|nr:hypothetical protein [Inquilinus limosus]